MGLLVWSAAILSTIPGLRWNEAILLYMPFDVVLPFLDTLGRYELVVAFAEHGAGSPDGALQLEGAPSPATSGFLGLLALSVGDHERAVRHLQARVVFEETEAYEPDPECIEFWRRHLERARQAG